MSTILALDLGTSAFKCAAVTNGRLLAEPVELLYELDRRGDEIAVDDPEKLALLAVKALCVGADRAKMMNAAVTAIGICSQAQTFIPVNAFGDPSGPAVSWLESVAVSEADEIGRNVSDYATRSGFLKPSPQQFLPKTLRESRRRRLTGNTLLLLNEFVIYRLTGFAFGDTTQQGMGGFFDISTRKWSEDFVNLAGIRLSNLAVVERAAEYCLPLSDPIAAKIGLPRIPVYSCGNDQCCSAIGAGLTEPGDAVCNFGTAMVVYTVTSEQRMVLKESQIAGIDPLTGGYFLLAYESECGRLIEELHREHFSGLSIDDMLRSGRDEVHLLLENLSGSFGKLLLDLRLTSDTRLIASGGLSRSPALLEFLEERHSVRFETSPHGHASLLGIEAILRTRCRGE